MLEELLIEEEYLTPSQRKKLRRERKKNKNNNNIEQKTQNLTLKSVFPKTNNQKIAFDSYKNGKNLLLHGLPGTGKTFISLYLALNELLSENSKYNRIIIVRSVVPTRDMGFLPGSMTQKMEVYEAPYSGIFAELFGRGDAYSLFKNKKMVEFMSTSFIRGLTLNDAIVIVDELQNLNGHENDSIITRLGDNSRIIMCGDFRQTDLKFKDEKQGVIDFMEILDRMKSFDKIEFDQDDIVRSGIVKEYILRKFNL